MGLPHVLAWVKYDGEASGDRQQDHSLLHDSASALSSGHGEQQDGIQTTAPSREQVSKALKKYARFSPATPDGDEGDVAAALREDLCALQPARAAAIKRLLGD